MTAKRKSKATRHHREDYKVGRGRPPKETQFKPGQSGNPSGKRKGTRSRTTLIRDALDSKIWIVEDGKRKKITRYDALLRTIIDCALKQRNFKYVELLLKLSDQLEAKDQRAVAVRPLRIIDPTMTDREAAEAYAETLTAIPGLIEPDFEIDFD